MRDKILLNDCTAITICFTESGYISAWWKQDGKLAGKGLGRHRMTGCKRITYIVGTKRHFPYNGSANPSKGIRNETYETKKK